MGLRIRWTAPLCVVVLAFTSRRAPAQYEAPAESFVVNATKAYTWVEDSTNVVMLDGPVSIDIDQNHLVAQQAVVWITPLRGAILDQDRIEVALVGDASLVQPNGITRSGPRLFVDARVRGVIRISAPQRIGGDRSDADLYRLATTLRPVLLPGAEPGLGFAIEDETLPATQPTTRPTDYRPQQRVQIFTERFSTTTSPDETVAAVLPGKVQVLQKAADGSVLELHADSAVVFTPLKSLLDPTPAGQLRSIEQAITGIYLEGDVRIIRTPADPRREPEQRLTANRAFYDFTTDRAVLTDVVLHTTDPSTKLPVTVRAETVRQLARTENITEFQASKARLSTSSFHTPSYSIGATSAYVRMRDTGDPLTGTRTTFVAKNATFNAGGVPVFYLPAVGGTVPSRTALRNIETSNSRSFGFGVSTEWGLFESFGRRPPKDLDASYYLDYFSDRGPATGLRANYAGGFIEETTLDPWSFSGDFTSYLAYDHGTDDLGRRRFDVEPDDEIRGRFYWRHQHFLPDDWQVQLTGGYVSDPTFMEEWFNEDFRTSQPLQTSFYAKHQRDSEAFTFLASVQPNDFVTVADLYQEQFEVERLPEIGYRRIGDSLANDHLTFFSANTLSALRFNRSDASLEDIGFANIRDNRPDDIRSPGIPSLGDPWDLTHNSLAGAVPGDPTYRGDFRQEVDWPFSIGRFRAVPYVVGRYTEYSQTIDGGTASRLHSAVGTRLTTAFWKVDDTVESRLFDLHRLRHVVEPEVNVYAAAQNVDRTDLLVYDEPIDAITDSAAVRTALTQRWQTKRGGPGNWRSVDFVALTVAYNHFFSRPDEPFIHDVNRVDPAGDGAGDIVTTSNRQELRQIREFRGLYFVSMPEASIPRNTANTDAAWQISDNVEMLGDVEYNTEENAISTASAGFSVRQPPRLSYFIGWRHIGLDFEEYINDAFFRFQEQELALFAANYQLTTKYHLQFAHSYDFALQQTYRSSVGVIRQFDQFLVMVSARTDRLDGENAFFINVWPTGFERGGGSRAVRGVFAE